MEKKYDVAAMGELLIDFAMNGQSEQGNNCFEACPGTPITGNVLQEEPATARHIWKIKVLDSTAYRMC